VNPMDANWELVRDQLASRTEKYAPYVANTCMKPSAMPGWQRHRLSRRRSMNFFRTHVLPTGSRFFDRAHRRNFSELNAAFEERVRAVLLDVRFPPETEALESEVADTSIFVGYALVPSLIFLGRQEAAIDLADFAIERFFTILSGNPTSNLGSPFLYILLFVPAWTLGLASMALAETGP
jgi:hypothetical protein